MARKPSLTDDDAPELTDAELAGMRSAREMMSAEEFAAVSSVRGRLRSVEPKVSVTIRLSRSVVDAYKATGKGWKTRIDQMLVGSLDSVADPTHPRVLDNDPTMPTDGRARKRSA